MLEGERRDERKNRYKETVFNRVTLAALVGFVENKWLGGNRS